MSLTPCIITHIPTKKVVSVEEALDLVWNDSELRAEALDIAMPTKANPFIQSVRKSFQAALDKLGLKANVEFISDAEAEKIVGNNEEYKAQIIGTNAILSEEEKNNLSIAKKMESDGLDTKTIYLITGWERGRGGEWNYEIPDGKFKNNPSAFLKGLTGKGVRVEEIFSAPELFKKYPSLKDIRVYFDILPNGALGVFKTDSNSPDKQIGLEILPLVWSKEKNSPLWINYSNILIHELQHAIQEQEGYLVAPNYNSDSEYRLDRQEVEARNVMKRQNMSTEDRRKTPFSETEDVDRKDQLLFMKSSKGDVLGFVQQQPDGSYKVWIDPKTTDAETPVHELAGHIFMPLLKEAAPELHAKGVELIQNTPYLTNAKAQGLEGDAANEEALAQAIGEKGKQLSESKRPKFVEWLNSMWQKVGERLGITKPIKDLTLGEFTDLIAGSVLEGKALDLIAGTEKGQTKTEAPKPPVKSEAPKITSYAEVFSRIEHGAELTKEEVEEELPYFLNQAGLPPLNNKTNAKKSNQIYQELLSRPKAELTAIDSPIAKKMADWVESQQKELSITPIKTEDIPLGESALDAHIEAAKKKQQAFRKEFLGPNNLNSAFNVLADKLWTAYIKILEAASKAGKVITRGQAMYMAQKQVNPDGKHTTQEMADAAKAVYAYEKGTVQRDINKTTGAKNQSVKARVQAAVNHAYSFGFATGEESGMKEGIKEGKMAAAKTMKAALEGLKAELNPRQINGILTKFAKQRDFSPEGKQAFMDYVNNVIEDANYVLNERAGNKLKGRVASMANSDRTPANDQSLFRAFASLSINHMEPDVLDKYIEWGNMIVGKSLKNREALKQFILDQKAVQDAIIEERAEKIREGRERNLKEEYDRLKKEGDLPEGVSTFEEYKESKKPTPKEKRNLKDFIDNLEIPEGTDPQTRKVLETLKGQNLSLLSSSDMALLENALTNFEDTGELFAAGDIVARLQVWNEIAALPKFNRSVDKSDAKRLSLTNLFLKFFDIAPIAAKARAVLIQPWLAKAGQVYEKFEYLSGKFLKEAARLKLNRDNINKIDLFGFLNERGGESFEQLRDQKLADLETLRQEVEADKNSKDGDTASARSNKQRYEALKKSIEAIGLTPESTLESVTAKMTPNEMRLYEVARTYLNYYAERALRNMALYGNKDVDVIENYWPRNAHRIKAKDTETPLGNLEDFAMYGGQSNVGKNLFSRQKGRTGLIGKNGYYEPMGEMNFLNGLRETMFVALAANEYHRMQGVFNSSKGLSSLMKGEGAQKVKEYLSNLVTDTKNSGRYAIDTRTKAQRFFRTVVDAATGAIIKRPSQILKQPTALGMPLVLAPKETGVATGIAMKFLASRENSPFNDAVKNFISNSTLAFRLALPEHIEDNQQYAVDRSELEKAFNKLTKKINTIALGETITDADKYVSIIATLAGYIQHQVQTGKLKKASDFDIMKEDKAGWDQEAMAAGEQMQGRTNNENARIFFSQVQKDNPALYYLINFTNQAVRGVYINFRRAINPRSSRAEVQEALRSMAGYATAVALFSGATQLSNAIIYGVIQSIKEGLSDDDEEEKKRKRKMLEDYKEAQALSNRDAQIVREGFSLAFGTQNILVQSAINWASAEAFQAAQGEVKAMQEAGEIPANLQVPEIIDRTKQEYNPFFQSETIGAPGVMAEMIVKPIKRVAKADDREKAAMEEASIMALNLAKLSGPSDIVAKTFAQERKEKKAKEFVGRKLVEESKKVLNPNEPEQKRAKELFQSAIETKNTKLATESIGKFINAYPTKIQKRKAIESLLEGELNEEVLQGKVGIDSKLVDEFFKFYNGVPVDMGREGTPRNYELTKLKELAENKALADDLVRKYEAEYEKAKATRELLMSMNLQDPESGRLVKVPYPSWMKYYERKIKQQ